MQKLCQSIFLPVVLVIILGSCSAEMGEELSVEISDTNTKVPSSTVTITPSQTATFTPTITETVMPTRSNTLSPTPDEKITLAFTGVIVPARCVQAAIDERGNSDYIFDEVREILTAADLTIGVFNATMSDQINHIGCQTTWDLVGSPENADAMKLAGFDLLSVATNHIQDCGFISCGDTAFFDTLNHLDRVGIEYVGAGENLESALEPVVIEVNGIRFGFVSLGEINERVFADSVTPGIAVLTKINLEKAIDSVKKISDVVVVLPHSGPEDYPEVRPQQKYWARHAVMYGADLVVINHAHVLQGYQILEGVPVFYSLGNFVFDQIWARDHQQGAILLVTFEKTKIIGFEFIPTIVDQDGTVHLAVGTEKNEILDRIEELAQEIAESQ